MVETGVYGSEKMKRAAQQLFIGLGMWEKGNGGTNGGPCGASGMQAQAQQLQAGAAQMGGCA